MIENQEIPFFKNYEKYLPNIKIKKIIGEGTFGKVYLIQNNKTRQLYAMKIINKKNLSEDNIKKTKRELDILTSISHPNIIKVYKALEIEYAFLIIMEYIKTGDLYDYIYKNKKLSNEESALIFYQVFSTIEFLHLNKIVHRDIKPENILILKNKKIKLIDFGLCNYIKENNFLSTPCGSLNYASPESYKGKKYDGEKFDIWSLGILLFVMLTGYLPFEGNNIYNILNEIQFKKLEFPNWISYKAENLIRKMLEINPLKRINIEGIKKEHFYYYSKGVYNSKFNKKLEIKDNYSVERKNNIIYCNEVFSTISSSKINNLKNKKLITLLSNSQSTSINKDNYNEKKIIINKNINIKLSDNNDNIINNNYKFRNKNINNNEDTSNLIEFKTVNSKNLKKKIIQKKNKNFYLVDNIIYNNYTNRSNLKKVKIKFSTQNSSMNDSIKKQSFEKKNMKVISEKKKRYFIENKDKCSEINIFNQLTPIKVHHTKNNSNVIIDKKKLNVSKEKSASKTKNIMKTSIFCKFKI